MSEPETPHSKAEPIFTIVDTWFHEAFQGSPVARSTETWNVVHEAKEDLKRRLASLLEMPPMT